MRQEDFIVARLGESKIQSPRKMSNEIGDQIANYVKDNELVCYNIESNTHQADCDKEDIRLLKAGPREKIYFNPGHLHAAIVTCGGLCPGLNDVIRAITRTLWYSYGVKRITGIKNGYKGFLPEYDFSPVELTPDVVDDIHKMGGTILGSSRGGGDRVVDIVDSLERLNINLLFTIGGDGTLRGARDVSNEIAKRGLKIGVVGIPKTIDNDISFSQKSFGFETAVAKASEVVAAAHSEAHSGINGIGLVKVMGRESGFIAAYTAIAVHEANFVLIPEIPFDLRGENGFLTHLKKRLQRSNHAVIIIAEGANQDKLAEGNATDASGNKIFSDVGLWLKHEIEIFFKEENIEFNLKYIDPSYIIRSSKADPIDSAYCSRLGSLAVHAGMAGMTSVLVTLVNDRFVYLPIDIAVSKRNHVDTEGSLWRDVIEATQQPVSMRN